MRVEVTGLDGTDVSDSATFRVLSAPPTVRLIDAPTRAVVGRPVRVSFKVTRRASTSGPRSRPAPASCSRGAYLIRDGTGIVKWTPTAPGRAVLLIRAHGHQGQTASASCGSTVAPRPPPSPPPTVTLLEVPEHATVGRAVRARVPGRRTATRRVARIEAPGDEIRDLAVPLPGSAGRRFTWTPTEPGRYVGSPPSRMETATTTQATTSADRGAVPMTTARPRARPRTRGGSVPLVRRGRMRGLRGGRPPGPSRSSRCSSRWSASGSA